MHIHNEITRSASFQRNVQFIKSSQRELVNKNPGVISGRVFIPPLINNENLKHTKICRFSVFLSCTITFLLTFFTFLSTNRNILYNVSFFCNLYFFFVSILFALFKYAEHRAMPAFGKKNLFLLINNTCCDIIFPLHGTCLPQQFSGEFLHTSGTPKG